MSAYQKAHNSCLSLFSRFQNNWRGESTALEAFNVAKAAKVQELAESIEVVKGLSFGDMQAHGLIVRDITEACKR